MSLPCLDAMNCLGIVENRGIPNGCMYIVYLERGDIRHAAGTMLAESWSLEDVSALDACEGFVLSYFFEHVEQACRICLRVVLPHEEPSVDSIAAIYQGADWHERETADFFGISFVGHPNPVRLLLPSDMDIFPLRKAEAARAPVATLFPCPAEALVFRKPGFTLLDVPSGDKPEASQTTPATASAPAAAEAETA